MESAELSTSTILLVDDQESNIVFLERLLKHQGYKRVISMVDSREVLPYIKSQEPDLILLDLSMPYLDGWQILAELKNLIPKNHYVPVIVLTADSSRETRLRALSAGAIDFLTKPLDTLEILNRIHNLLYSRHLHKQQHLHSILLEKTVEVRTLELVRANHELEKANASLGSVHHELLAKLSLAAEYRDDDTGEHAMRVAKLAYLIALQLGLPITTAELILQAARLHDIGKIGIPDHILLKPGKLSIGEMKIMKTHCQIGARLLEGSSSKFLAMAKTIALTHHERWDGKGYPVGLCAEDIPIEGRIVAIADLFDALTSNRSYRPAWPRDEAIRLILEEKGHSFDPQVVDAFLAVLTVPPKLETLPSFELCN
jgi:putative two-component system response regulator